MHGNSNMLAQSEFEIKQLVTDRVSKGVFRHLQKKNKKTVLGICMWSKILLITQGKPVATMLHDRFCTI